MAQADAWACGPADERLCPQDKTLTVGQAFVHEKPRLLALPANHYPVQERLVVKVGKTPYVRFDLNDYSVPHTQVRKALTVLADTKTVRILDAQVLVASHVRSYVTYLLSRCHVEDLMQEPSGGQFDHAHPRQGVLLAAPSQRL